MRTNAPPNPHAQRLKPLHGFPFAVLASEHAGAAATRIALRAQDASDLLRDVLGVAPQLSLRILDREELGCPCRDRRVWCDTRRRQW